MKNNPTLPVYLEKFKIEPHGYIYLKEFRDHILIVKKVEK